MPLIEQKMLNFGGEWRHHDIERQLQDTRHHDTGTAGTVKGKGKKGTALTEQLYYVSGPAGTICGYQKVKKERGGVQTRSFFCLGDVTVISTKKEKES